MKPEETLAARKLRRGLLVLLLLFALPGGCYGVLVAWKHNVFPEPVTVELTDKPGEWQGIIPGLTYEIPSNAYMDERNGKYYIGVTPWDQSDSNSSQGTRTRIEYETIHLGKGATFRVDRIFRFSSSALSSVTIFGRVVDHDRIYDGVQWKHPHLGRATP